MVIAGEVLVLMVQPNPSGALLTIGPPLVQQLVPNGHFDLVPFVGGLVEEGQDVEEPSVSDLLVVGLRPDWLVGRASSEASLQLVVQQIDQMVAGAPAEVVGEDSAGEAGATGVGFAPTTGAPPAVWMQEEGELVGAMEREVS